MKNRAQFLSTNVFVLIASNFANAVNYVFQLAMGRVLTSADFGLFNAVMSLSIALSMASVIPYWVSRQTATHYDDPAKLQQALQPSYMVVAWIAFLGTILPIILSRAIQHSFHISDPLPAILFGALAGSAILVLYYQGIIQGLQLYVLSSFIGSVNAIVKLATALSFVLWCNMRYNGPLLASVLGNCGALLLNRHYVRTRLPDLHKNKIREKSHISLQANKIAALFKELAPIALTLNLYGIFSGSDLLLVQYFNGAEITGSYAVVSLVGKIALLLPSALSSVLFAKVSLETAQGRSSLQFFWMSSLITVGIGGAFSLAAWLGAPAFVEWFYPGKFQIQKELFPIIATSMSLYALLFNSYHFLLAKRIYSYLTYAYFGLACFCVAIFFLPEKTPKNIAIAFLLHAVAQCFMMGMQMLRAHRRSLSTR